MKDIARHLQEVGPTISKLCELSGAAGASVGVLHQNQVIYTAGFGYCDVAAKISPDENTVYHIASLSKAFTGAAVSILVDEKLLDWEQPVSKILPEFSHNDAIVETQSNLLDMVAHRTCLAHKSALWLQDWTTLLLTPKDLFPTISYTELTFPFRSQWFYSNWGYCVAATMLERVTGQTWAEFLTQRIFAPLELKKTSLERYPKGDNVAKSYQAFLDGSPSPVEPPELVAGTIMQGALGVISSVSDLLSFYKALIKAWNMKQTAIQRSLLVHHSKMFVRCSKVTSILNQIQHSNSPMASAGLSANSQLLSGRSAPIRCSFQKCLLLGKVRRNKLSGTTTGVLLGSSALYIFFRKVTLQ